MGSAVNLQGSASNLNGSASQLEPPPNDFSNDYSRNNNQYQNRTSELAAGAGMMDNTYTNATQERMYNSDMSLVMGNSA